MNPTPDPQPGIAFQKAEGKWTFYIYPDGVQREAGEFADESTANEASVTALRIWEANNGKQFGPASVITSQTFISGL
jgi:hypothetical protein